jgi:hypothetical protein
VPEKKIQGFSFLNATCAKGRIMTAPGRLLSCAMLDFAALSLAGCIGNPPQGNGPDQPASQPTTTQIDNTQNNVVFELTPAASWKVRDPSQREAVPAPARRRRRLLHKLDLAPNVAADDYTFIAGEVSAVVSPSTCRRCASPRRAAVPRPVTGSARRCGRVLALLGVVREAHLAAASRPALLALLGEKNVSGRAFVEELRQHDESPLLAVPAS